MTEVTVGSAAQAKEKRLLRTELKEGLRGAGEFLYTFCTSPPHAIYCALRDPEMSMRRKALQVGLVVFCPSFLSAISIGGGTYQILFGAGIGYTVSAAMTYGTGKDRQAGNAKALMSANQK